MMITRGENWNLVVVIPQIALNSAVHENDQQLAVLIIRKVRMLDSYCDSTCPPQKEVDGHPFLLFFI